MNGALFHGTIAAPLRIIETAISVNDQRQRAARWPAGQPYSTRIPLPFPGSRVSCELN
jgi:hypothetical protein